ncbi:mechanosensitive ion channel family protein [Aquabacterium sp. A7-Y]|uniref:mechanosensitive ion channel family protein n=1 Tax=Aquabacterium sp. A7-Y TaxID=1349605 RepID=UPI00223D4A5E|nr:mechanosensitive ion channel domain-containing protein [Aquabacterium sp. A7-Y]MCW7541061.1 mechanosensitive ion channel family protein [Aquabacterium sp. A7-Y]
MQQLVELLHRFAVGDSLRLTLTLAVMIGATAVLRLSQKHLINRAGSMAEKRERFVLSRNVIILAALVAVAAIWFSKIAGFALSLAAVAGAMLIVSKEAISNFLGFAMMTISRPYRLGDYIQIGTAGGRVVDIDAMCTTLIETLEGHQATGRTVTVPNAMLLTQPVRNLSVTGQFVVHLLHLGLEPTDDLLAHEAVLLEAAGEICEPWRTEANAHLSRLEQISNVDLPSAEPRVIIELGDAKQATLALRYVCRPNERVKVEQAILRHYLAHRPAPSPVDRPDTSD